eukprot:2079934-Rhodomonas_salina.2
MPGPGRHEPSLTAATWIMERSLAMPMTVASTGATSTTSPAETDHALVSTAHKRCFARVAGDGADPV